ncbi:hypothetical protein F0562_023346 [Nyssa sinensis]|uniref:Uncharacterized protein n=1 Tax=Nyssa sinensis TaxID=561372 RepID=A0A5J5BHN7_9ASTE|nr:hypothetical protein F0562_023346 [Nyssa sinensis]
MSWRLHEWYQRIQHLVEERLVNIWFVVWLSAFLPCAPNRILLLEIEAEQTEDEREGNSSSIAIHQVAENNHDGRHG